MNQPAEQDPRVYFALERTFLAWIRTGLGLMAVGFAVSRFGIFLREFSANTTHRVVHSIGVSEWSGVALVVLGVAVDAIAIVRHIRIVRELKTGTWIPGQVSTSVLVLGALLAVAGLAMAVYLSFPK